MLITIVTINTTQISITKYDKVVKALSGMIAIFNADTITSITVAKHTVYAKIDIAEYAGVVLTMFVSVFWALKKIARLTIFKINARQAYNTINP